MKRILGARCGFSIFGRLFRALFLNVKKCLHCIRSYLWLAPVDEEFDAPGTCPDMTDTVHSEANFKVLSLSEKNLRGTHWHGQFTNASSTPENDNSRKTSFNHEQVQSMHETSAISTEYSLNPGTNATMASCGCDALDEHEIQNDANTEHRPDTSYTLTERDDASHVTHDLRPKNVFIAEIAWIRWLREILGTQLSSSGGPRMNPNKELASHIALRGLTRDRMGPSIGFWTDESDKNKIQYNGQGGYEDFSLSAQHAECSSRKSLMDTRAKPTGHMENDDWSGLVDLGGARNMATKSELLDGPIEVLNKCTLRTGELMCCSGQIRSLVSRETVGNAISLAGSKYAQKSASAADSDHLSTSKSESISGSKAEGGASEDFESKFSTADLSLFSKVGFTFSPVDGPR